ncbi:MAG TPA: hypothetical protein P5236_01930 [Paludibacteraceae bacterium]|nr:hypothetical protein [Paludibacteraceae bacterium]
MSGEEASLKDFSQQTPIFPPYLTKNLPNRNDFPLNQALLPY